MSEKVFLALVGGRSATPTIMGALQFLEEFDRIKFLLCEHPNNLYQNFSDNTIRILKAQKKDLLCENEEDIKTVNGNDFKQVYDAVEKLCENTELKFVNVTSAPQEMAFSVYNYVSNNYTEAIVFNVNTHKSQITPLVLGVDPIVLSKRLSVENYVSACETEIFKRKFDIKELSCDENQAQKLVDFFIDDIEKLNKLLSVIRQGEKVKTPKTISIKKNDIASQKISHEELIEFFNILKQNQIISKFNEEKYSYRVEKQSDYAFLYGDWLEYFVYLEGKKIGFDSIEMSVELNNFKGEIDVFCVHNANALICECKTGKYDTDDLARLESKAVKLGGNYCVRLFITTNLNVDEKFINQAKNRKVVVVSGSELKDIEAILNKQMNIPDFTRN